MLDLYHFSFHVIDQIHLPDLPGVLVSPPPKKNLRSGHRGGASRENDWLILFLSLTGKNLLKPEELSALLERISQTYYKSGGSLTAGMRAAAETCNAQLVERNLKSARDENGQVLGRLNLAVLRDDSLFLATAGPTHTFVLGAEETQDCYDPQSNRGLGASAAVPLRYFQASLKPGDVLVFSPEPPAAWTPEALTGSSTLTLEHLRRRLLNGMGDNLEAVVFKFQAGSGVVHALRHRSTTTPAAPMAHPMPASAPLSPDAEPAAAGAPPAASPLPAEQPEEPAAPVPAPSEPAAPPESPLGSEPGPDERPAAADEPAQAAFTPPEPGLPPARQSPPQRPPVNRPAAPTQAVNALVPPLPAQLEARPTARRVRPGQPQPSDEPARGAQAEAAAQASQAEQARLARQRRARRKQKAATAWNGWKQLNARISQGWRSFASRLVPQRAPRPGSLPLAPDQQVHPTVSPAVLIFIAIAIPLVVVAISLTVYLQSGRSEQRQAYYQQATTFAQQALAQSDPLLQRNNWNQVLQWLDKAEDYGVTSDSRALRVRAQQGVDSVDAINRVEFKPVNRVGFANAVRLNRLVSSRDDLYALDGSNGSVLRLFQTAQGYELDTQFTCGPGIVDSVIIGPLIDIAPMPVVNPKNATIAAVDGGGNLVYCIPGKTPVVRALAPPNVGWGKIAGLNMVQDTLYVFDLLGNAVYEYSGKDLVFTERPRLYSEKFNLSLADVTDMAQYEDNVYFLRKSGQISRCTLSKVSDVPSRCDNPAKYNDGRPGREHSTQTMPDTLFTQMLTINAPDPSLYLLDVKNAAVYRFSVVLNFQDQMRPSGTTATTLPHSEPTAFTITSRRIVFLAYGSQLFMGQMP